MGCAKVYTLCPMYLKNDSKSNLIIPIPRIIDINDNTDWSSLVKFSANECLGDLLRVNPDDTVSVKTKSFGILLASVFHVARVFK